MHLSKKQITPYTLFNRISQLIKLYLLIPIQIKMFTNHTGTKKARIIGTITDHPGLTIHESGYRHASRHRLIFASKRGNVYSLSNFALPAAPNRFRKASSSSNQPIRSASGSTSLQGTRKPVSPSSTISGVPPDGTRHTRQALLHRL